MIGESARLLAAYGVSPTSIKLLRMIEAMIPADVRAMFLEMLLDLCGDVARCAKKQAEYEMREQARKVAP